MGRYRFDPERYRRVIDEEIPSFGEFQDAVAAATKLPFVRSVLELGTGTGETARRVLALHPAARFVGIDESGDMLAEARNELGGAELRVARLEDPLPVGTWDVVVSALTVHHLDSAGKRDLFARVRSALAPGGRFVLGDVVVPERPEDAVTPLTPGFDLPDSAADQVAWLRQAGFAPEIVWRRADLAVLRADAALA
jgi:tRNA (cmo5U34)-methyltransferase